jgi:RNA 2',3'-cyclic 3'-phosphodiesterase
MSQKHISIKQSRRLFFALWPEAELQQQFFDIARLVNEQCRGNLVPLQNMHLTLVFIGAVEQTSIAQFIDAAKAVRCEPFSLRLNRIGAFRSSKIVWLAPEKTPPELSELVSNLQQALRIADFGFDNKPFVPHITLLRKAGLLEETTFDAALEWQVNGFALVQSHSDLDGVRYEVLRHFPV